MKNTRSHGRPWQSRLIPYEEEILELRRRRPPMPFGQITARLETKYGVKVHLDTVHNFVKVRSGLYRETSRKHRSIRATTEPFSPASTPPPGKSEWDSLYSEARVLTPNPKKANS
jgi:hypothetical protein